MKKIICSAILSVMSLSYGWVNEFDYDNNDNYIVESYVDGNTVSESNEINYKGRLSFVCDDGKSILFYNYRVNKDIDRFPKKHRIDSVYIWNNNGLPISIKLNNIDRHKNGLVMEVDDFDDLHKGLGWIEIVTVTIGNEVIRSKFNINDFERSEAYKICKNKE